MAKTFYYQSTQSMEPRPGTAFATTYYKQNLDQRKQLTKHIFKCSREIVGALDQVKKNGDPKDYAQAPIERWNKLFHDTEYQFHMEQNEGTTKTTFDTLWETAE
jgi:hypothetical protein